MYYFAVIAITIIRGGISANDIIDYRYLGIVNQISQLLDSEVVTEQVNKLFPPFREY